jgi:hypothetical protein
LHGAHTGEYMTVILYKVLERFSIIKQLLYIMTDNTGNNGTIRKELEELLNNLDVNNSWSSDSTKIPCLVHIIQFVIKAILGVFNIKPVESEDVKDDVNGKSVNSTIAKVWC